MHALAQDLYLHVAVDWRPGLGCEAEWSDLFEPLPRWSELAGSGALARHGPPYGYLFQYDGPCFKDFYDRNSCEKQLPDGRIARTTGGYCAVNETASRSTRERRARYRGMGCSLAEDVTQQLTGATKGRLDLHVLGRIIEVLEARSEGSQRTSPSWSWSEPGLGRGWVSIDSTSFLRLAYLSSREAQLRRRAFYRGVLWPLVRAGMRGAVLGNTAGGAQGTEGALVLQTVARSMRSCAAPYTGEPLSQRYPAAAVPVPVCGRYAPRKEWMPAPGAWGIAGGGMGSFRLGLHVRVDDGRFDWPVVPGGGAQGTTDSGSFSRVAPPARYASFLVRALGCTGLRCGWEGDSPAALRGRLGDVDPAGPRASECECAALVPQPRAPPSSLGARGLATRRARSWTLVPASNRKWVTAALLAVSGRAKARAAGMAAEGSSWDDPEPNTGAASPSWIQTILRRERGVHKKLRRLAKEAGAMASGAADEIDFGGGRTARRRAGAERKRRRPGAGGGSAAVYSEQEREQHERAVDEAAGIGLFGSGESGGATRKAGAGASASGGSAHDGRSSAAGVQAALQDWLSLSSCHLVVHALASSFAEEAAVAAGAPLLSLGPNGVVALQMGVGQEAAGLFTDTESRTGIASLRHDAMVVRAALRNIDERSLSDEKAVKEAERELGVDTGSGGISATFLEGFSRRLGVKVIHRGWAPPGGYGALVVRRPGEGGGEGEAEVALGRQPAGVKDPGVLSAIADAQDWVRSLAARLE